MHKVACAPMLLCIGVTLDVPMLKLRTVKMPNCCTNAYIAHANMLSTFINILFTFAPRYCPHLDVVHV